MRFLKSKTSSTRARYGTLSVAAFAFTLAVALIAVGCAPEYDKQTPVVPPAQTSEAQTISLKQGWDAATRERFRYTSQGSELIPYYWFLNLMSADGKAKFVDTLDNFGFLHDPSTPDIQPKPLNPNNLPIGFAYCEENETINGLKEKHWLGLTCAACHTGAVSFKAKPTDTAETIYIVDGAPTAADLGGFLKDLGVAVKATNNDPARLKAFAEKVVLAKDGASVEDVTSRFKTFAAQFEKIVALSASANPWGPGRTDAFGVIFNRVCNYDLQGSPDKPHLADAPVSFPFIWLSNRQDKIQWHGEVPNKNWGFRLLRNAGEALGVFTRADVNRGYDYRSSIDIRGLGLLDQYVETLNPPTWPKELPPPDKTQLALGKKVFYDSCSKGWCHRDPAPLGGMLAMQTIPLQPNLNTDDAMTKMAHTRVAAVGEFAGTFKLGLPLETFDDNPASQVPAGDILGRVGAGVFVGKLPEALEALKKYLDFCRSQKRDMSKEIKREDLLELLKNQAYKMTDPPPKKDPDTPYDPKFDGYEARPLAGIWATAPYLHNGSVPNLMELLWPQKREAKFWVGSIVYDPVNVGYMADKAHGKKEFDTTLPGNHNTGHTYGSNLSEKERWALIEYLKTL